MTYDPNGPVNTGNYPPPKKSKAPLIAGLTAAVFVLVACAVGVSVLAAADDLPAAGGRVISTPKLTPNPITGDVPDTGTRPAARTLGVKDFQATAKVTGKDCIDFQTIPDSCTFTYEVKLSIADPDAYAAAGDSYAVTVEVKGLKGGGKVDTYEVGGDGNYTGWPGDGEGTPKTKLSARVTDVEKRP